MPTPIIAAIASAAIMTVVSLIYAVALHRLYKERTKDATKSAANSTTTSNTKSAATSATDPALIAAITAATTYAEATQAPPPEVVAAITAALTAYIGSSGYTIKSVRRVPAWNAAARIEQQKRLV